MAQVAGWERAPGLVMGFHALLGLWLIYRLGRKAGLGENWALLGPLLLALLGLSGYVANLLGHLDSDGFLRFLRRCGEMRRRDHGVQSHQR